MTLLRTYVATLTLMADDDQTKFRQMLYTAPSASRMTRILLVALSVAGRRAKQPTGAPNASHHGAAKIQIAAAACRTKATSRAGVGELRHETNQVLPTSW